jgi:hypothetical protein
MRRNNPSRKLLAASLGVAAVSYSACTDGGTIIGNHIPPPCTTTQSCPSGLVCADGVCEAPCGENGSPDCNDAGSDAVAPPIDASVADAGDGSVADTGASADGGDATSADSGDAAADAALLDAGDASDAASADASDASND